MQHHQQQPVAEAGGVYAQHICMYIFHRGRMCAATTAATSTLCGAYWAQREKLGLLLLARKMLITRNMVCGSCWSECYRRGINSDHDDGRTGSPR